VVGICADGAEARSFLLNNEVDIVFTDIDMPNLNGLDLLRSLKKFPAFVFTTSYPEYAVTGFELDAVDFLVKPLTFDRIARSVDKVIEYITMKQKHEANDISKHQNETVPKSEEYIFIRETPDLVRVKFNDIAYIESMGEFSKIFTVSNTKHVTLVSLKNLEAQLPQVTFMRIHKQFIINCNNIAAIGSNDVTINNTKIPLSNSYKQLLLDRVVNNNVLNRFINKN
jgi:DNA-binding LytR/AlgR family response regulator